MCSWLTLCCLLPEIGTERACYRDMSSFPETKAEKYVNKIKGKKFLQYNRLQLSRIYPKGQRLDSSNYDPLPMWICGSQLVALNFQTPGEGTRQGRWLLEYPVPPPSHLPAPLLTWSWQTGCLEGALGLGGALQGARPGVHVQACGCHRGNVLQGAGLTWGAGLSREVVVATRTR